jgi:hypothetical protein
MRDQSTSLRFPENLAEFVRFLPPTPLMASFGPFKRLLFTDPSICRVSSLGVDEAEAKRYTSRDATIAQLHTFISRAA